MSVTMDGLYVDGEKVVFHPEDILTGDPTAYTEEIGTAVNAWMEENVTGGEQVTDTTLTLSGVPADAKVTGDEIGALKEDFSVTENSASFTFEQGTIKYSDGINNNSTTRIRSDALSAEHNILLSLNIGALFKYSYRIYANNVYNQNKSVDSFVTGTNKIILEKGESIRFVISYVSNGMSINPSTETDFVCQKLQFTDDSLTMASKAADAKTVGKLLNEIDETVDTINDKIDGIITLDYQIYSPTFSLSPSAIENDGNLIDTLTGTKTTDYIDCSTWKGIRYTGSSWLVCRCLAFYDENQTWISSMPEMGDTTEYTNEIVTIPSNAKYVIFADLTAKQAQTLSIEVATQYTTQGKWAGKKWTCVGDSLTESNLRTTMNYHDYVSEATGITVVNMGRSGTGYMHTWDEGYAFYQRVLNVPTDSDVVTIFGSGNDLNHISDLGSPTDSGSADNPTTICGCINKTLDNLIGLMPTVSLGIVAPTPWKNEKPTLNNTNPMAQYVEALRQICYIRSIPFLDLYHCSNLRPWTAEGRAACYSKDDGNGTHPDEEGHKLIAPRFEAFVESLLLH